MADVDICEMQVGGHYYGGWTDIHIQRGLEQVSGQFALQVTDHWPNQDTPRPIRPGQACVLVIDGDTVLTGWVGTVSPGADAERAWIRADGRDKTGDLIDCSAVYKSGQWLGKSLATIAKDLTAPFGITVVIGSRATTQANKKMTSFRLEEGETVFECLERAARLAAVMMWTDGKGQLIIDLPGTDKAKVKLEQGVNILSCEGTFSWNERFSEYIVKGQSRGKAGHDAKGTATDSTVTRYRPAVILAEEQVNGPSAAQRAEWECTVRKGRSNKAKVKVQGWHQCENGPLWAPGLRVDATIPRLHLNGQVLISSVTYMKNEQEGTVTELEIVDPRAFDLLSGVRTAALKSKRGGDKGLANNKDRHKPKAQKANSDDWGEF